MSDNKSFEPVGPGAPEPSVGRAATSARGRASRRLALAAVVAIVLVMPAIPFSSYNYVLQLGTNALMWVAMASSWNILAGDTGYISLGHKVFLGIGGGYRWAGLSDVW